MLKSNSTTMFIGINYFFYFVKDRYCYIAINYLTADISNFRNQNKIHCTPLRAIYNILFSTR